jgi:molybdenum cofactor biosynthesis enzyme MoaA
MDTGLLERTGIENKDGILEDCSRKSLVVNHLPFFYHVHLNMPCNQKCIMCVPNGKHRRDTLPFEGFVQLFGQIRPYAEHITLIGGEPFMYPWIDGVLDLLAQHPIAVSIATNCTMLTPKVTPRLLALHELNLRCSIDAVTRETYHRIRGRDVFDKVTTNLRRFAEASRDLPRVRMRLCYVVMRENLDEVLPFLDFAGELGVHTVQFNPVRHVRTWRVQNGTGWTFDGAEQSCESFRDEYNEVMRRAADRGPRVGVRCEVHLL